MQTTAGLASASLERYVPIPKDKFYFNGGRLDRENARRPIELSAEEFWEKWHSGSITPQAHADFMVDLERVVLTRMRDRQRTTAPHAVEAEGFNWSDPDSVVVERVYAIAVYKESNGDIVIRQERSGGEQDSLIVVPARYAPMLVEAIQRQLKGLLFAPAPPQRTDL